jgi:hypothetical protein
MLPKTIRYRTAIRDSWLGSPMTSASTPVTAAPASIWNPDAVIGLRGSLARRTE